MKTLFIGQNAVHLTAVDSTNSYASEMLRQNRPVEGTIIYTFEQTAGRGQRGNDWYGEPSKNVAFSLILYPTFLKADEQFLLTKMVSLAVADLMAEILKNPIFTVRIKWPNDIYVHDHKIAGILIENTISDQSIVSTVIGIGLNINQLAFPGNTGNPTSVKLLTGEENDLNLIIERLCEFLEARYLQLKSGRRDQIDYAYLQNLYRLDEWKKYTSGNGEFEGMIRSVSPSGKLQIELHNAEIKEFDLKEIGFVR